MSGLRRYRGLGLGIVAILFGIMLPKVFSSNYALSVMILSSMYIIFALSYDLSAGHVGAIHLAPQAFFGLGAYVTALVGAKLGLGFFTNVLLAALSMGLLALLVGIPSFRLSNVTFAIGTLGFAVISQQIVTNAFEITNGPLCMSMIPRPSFVLPGGFEIAIKSAADYYYLLLPLVVLTVVLYLALIKSRIGRAFVAVREDETLASASGVNPLRYKMLAFSMGSAIAGGLGSFQAQYVTVICPTELAFTFNTTLLIMLFVGGVGTLRGVVMGAIIFTVLPELLRKLGSINVTPALQQLTYGLILVLIVVYAPGGLNKLVDDWKKKFLRRGIGSKRESGEVCGS